jgi:hypothetical protein
MKDRVRRLFNCMNICSTILSIRYLIIQFVIGVRFLHTLPFIMDPELSESHSPSLVDSCTAFWARTFLHSLYIYAINGKGEKSIKNCYKRKG